MYFVRKKQTRLPEERQAHYAMSKRGSKFGNVNQESYTQDSAFRKIMPRRNNPVACRARRISTARR